MYNKCIIIVRYENDPEIFKKNILELSKLSKVYVYDNSKVGIEFDNNNIYYFHNKENGGLAKAINHIVDVALADGKELAVYFDQDSSINTSMIQNLFSSYYNLKNKYNNLFVVGPQPMMQDGKDYPIKLGEHIFGNYYKASEIITSGMTFRLEDIKNIGYFDEDLFLDMVDFDICWRALVNRKLIAVDKSIKMCHEVGINNINFFFRKLPISSPIRNYYQVRNVIHIILRKQKLNKILITYYLSRRLFSLILNILFADNKIKRIKFNLLGIRDAFINKMGKINDV
jgi:rhamnosyltransferase